MSILMYKRVLFAVILATVLMFSFHSSLAAQLDELPLYQAEFYGWTFQNCTTLSAELEKFYKNQIHRQSHLVNYFTSLAVEANKWYQELSQYENKNSTWALNEFKNVRSSVQILNESADNIYVAFKEDEDATQTIRAAVMDCVLDEVLRAHAIYELDQYSEMNSGHLPSIADLLSTMSNRLHKLAKIWSSLEGQSVQLNSGYFDQLRDEVAIYTEGTTLISESSGFILEQYQVFLSTIRAQVLPLDWASPLR